MAERVWTELDAAAADGLACVVCGRDFRLRRSPGPYSLRPWSPGPVLGEATGPCR